MCYSKLQVQILNRDKKKFIPFFSFFFATFLDPALQLTSCQIGPDHHHRGEDDKDVSVEQR